MDTLSLLPLLKKVEALFLLVGHAHNHNNQMFSLFSIRKKPKDALLCKKFLDQVVFLSVLEHYEIIHFRENLCFVVERVSITLQS